MARWTDLAPRQEHTENQGPGMTEVRGLVVHIAQGTYEGTIAWQKNTAADVSSHFVVSKSGTICQMVDTDTAAWTQVQGNGHWISVENEGYSGTPLTAAQLDANARIFSKVCQVYGTPYQTTSSTSGKGLGHHGMGGAAWGNHPDCPGTPIVNQKPQIVSRAKSISEGDMALEGNQAEQLEASAEWSGAMAGLRDTGYQPPNETVPRPVPAVALWKDVQARIVEIQDMLSEPSDVQLSDEQLEFVADKVAERLRALTFIAEAPPVEG